MVVLSKDTFFQLRRLYLLGSIIFACVFPYLIQWQWFQIDDLAYSINLPIYEITERGRVSESVNSNTWSWEFLLDIIYFLGVIYASTKLMISGYQLMKLISNGDKKEFADYTLIKISGINTPFSFFKYIVIDPTKYSINEYKRILLHEREHIYRRHSIDVIIIELIGVVLWCHPMIYLYKKQLRINHEYQADQRVIAEYSRKQYGHILLKQSESGKAIVFANYFFHSFIKKRIMMMYNKRSHKNNQLKYLIVFPLIFGLLFFMSNCTSDTKSITDTIDTKQVSEMVSNDEEVYTAVEEMPRFPGCEEIQDTKEKKLCSRNKILNYIYSHVKYPKLAKDNGTQGNAVVQFVVKADGHISDVVVLRDLKDGCGKASKEAIEAMEKEGIVWIPGKESGKNVSVKYTIPVKFRLEG